PGKGGLHRSQPEGFIARSRGVGGSACVQFAHLGFRLRPAEMNAWPRAAFRVPADDTIGMLLRSRDAHWQTLLPFEKKGYLFTLVPNAACREHKVLLVSLRVEQIRAPAVVNDPGIGWTFVILAQLLEHPLRWRYHQVSSGQTVRDCLAIPARPFSIRWLLVMNRHPPAHHVAMSDY